MTIDVKSRTKWRPHVLSSVLELDDAVPLCSWGTYPGHDPNEGQAADAMIPKWALAFGIAIGNKLAGLVATVAWMKLHGGWYVIWRGRIWSMTRPQLGWLPYFDRNNPNPSRSHKNHVHLSWYSTGPISIPVQPKPAPFTEGWVPETPWTFYLDLQRPNDLDKAGKPLPSRSVWLIQKALGLPVRDGIWTDELKARVQAWQLNTLGDTRANSDGVLGPKQARALFGPLVKIEAKA